MSTTNPDLVLGPDSDGAALAIAAAINNLEEANDPNRYEIERKIAALNAIAHAIIGLTFTLDARLKPGTLRPLGTLVARVNKS